MRLRVVRPERGEHDGVRALEEGHRLVTPTLGFGLGFGFGFG
jgi:hypothetical protein